MEINFGAIFRSTMQKAKVHKGHRYAFGGLITKLYCLTSVPTEEVDYCSHIEAPHVVTNIKDPKVSTSSVLTITERTHRDELSMAHIYGLKMLRHRIRGRPSIPDEI